MLFQLCGSLYVEYFLKVPLHDIKPHKLLQLLWWRQLSKSADHSCLSVQQRAKAVVLFTKMNNVTAMQRRFWNISWTCWAPARNTIQGGSNMTGTDLCVNKPHCTAAAQCGLFTHRSVPVIFEPPCT